MDDVVGRESAPIDEERGLREEESVSYQLQIDNGDLAKKYRTTNCASIRDDSSFLVWRGDGLVGTGEIVMRCLVVLVCCVAPGVDRGR